MYKQPRRMDFADRDFSYQTYSDMETGGNSAIDIQKNDESSIDIVYTLGDKYDFPNVSFSMYNNDYSIVDFSGYDFVTLNAESVKSKFLLLQFNIFIDGYSQKGSHETYLPVGYYLELNESDNICKIPLNLFNHHRWWFSTYQVSEDIIKDFSYGSVLSLKL